MSTAQVPDRAPLAHTVQARNIDPQAENKIHDEHVARSFGFGGALVPGVELFAYLTRPFVAAWGAAWLAGGALEVRFRRPVYDGELLTAMADPRPDGAFDVRLAGADGTVRSVGTASSPSPQPSPDRTRYTLTPLPERLAPPVPASLPVGPLGTITEPVDVPTNLHYLEAVGETLPLYPRECLVHPGILLRVVNAALMRNVALGPWIHTASSVRFLAPAHVPAELSVHSVITGTYRHNDHEYVRYDALVLCDGSPVMEVDHTAIYAL